jgi:Uncharacterized conserved protein (DUF2183)
MPNMLNPHPCQRRQLLVTLAASAAGLSTGTTAVHAGQLERDEGVLLFPSIARRIDETRVAVRVQGWIYEQESNRLATWLMAKYLGLDLDELIADERERFLSRAGLFSKEAQARRSLRARLDEAMPWITLAASGRDGRVDATLIVPRTGLTASELNIQVASGTHHFTFRAQLHEPQGLSIVSDIDDTIKHTQVRDRKAMLLNTFARPFAAVPGMAEWYGRIAAAQPTAFHYVSSGPFQMFPAVQGFLDEARLPPGSMHLRAFSLKPNALFSKSASSNHKHTSIERLLADYPQRRFVLIGDSGEHDPEIYGEVARRHPKQITAILIRDVTGDTATGPRYREAFTAVPSGRWQLFQDPSSLPVSWNG